MKKERNLFLLKLDLLNDQLTDYKLKNGSQVFQVLPIEQLTTYALALSRLTGLRLYELRCAWFDDRHYFEFFPLHVVYRKAKRKRLPRSQKKRVIYESRLEGKGETVLKALVSGEKKGI